MREIVFEVPGFPPAKSEALSLLGIKHPHLPRVRILLQRAQEAIAATRFEPLTVPIGIDVIIRAPAGRDPWDATNYLGGIGDTLQYKRKRLRISLEHLEDLADVALYEDDRQIREVHYRQESADNPSYTVRIWSLSLT